MKAAAGTPESMPPVSRMLSLATALVGKLVDTDAGAMVNKCFWDRRYSNQCRAVLHLFMPLFGWWRLTRSYSIPIGWKVLSIEISCSKSDMKSTDSTLGRLTDRH